MVLNDKPDVSVVVTTKNEEKHIGNCLTAILSSDCSDISLEVIVVDNFSTDKTPEIVRQFPDVVFHEVGPERNAQRNFGLLKTARGKYLFWLDADHIIHPVLIKSCVKELEKKPEVVALTIPEIILGNSFYAKTRRFERFFYEATPIDGSRFIRADAFKLAGGFATDWLHGPDDWDLDLRLSSLGQIAHLRNFYDTPQSFHDFIFYNFGLRTKDYPVGMYHNESHLTLRQHLAKKIHYSHDFSGYINRYGMDHPSLKKQLGAYYRLIGVFVENGKWKKAIKRPILILSAMFIKFLAGLVYLRHRK
jgi:glycosyltransferase involved in cell wall biosynthesis